MLESFSRYFFAGKWGKTIIILTVSQNQNNDGFLLNALKHFLGYPEYF